MRKHRQRAQQMVAPSLPLPLDLHCLPLSSLLGHLPFGCFYLAGFRCHAGSAETWTIFRCLSSFTFLHHWVAMVTVEWGGGKDSLKESMELSHEDQQPCPWTVFVSWHSPRSLACAFHPEMLRGDRDRLVKARTEGKRKVGKGKEGKEDYAKNCFPSLA